MNILKKTLYNIIRNYLKKYFTGNLGKVIEEDDRLVCYVKKRKCERNKYDYTIACFGIMEKDKKLANAYQLNKPICYIIDGIKSERKKVYVLGYSNNDASECDVIVKNCRFNWDADIHINGKCTLENTYIRTFYSLSIEAKDLIIKNMNLDHKMKLAGDKYYLTIGANKNLSISDSSIGEIFDTVIVDVISSDGLNVTNSRVMGNEINIKSPKIKVDENSSFVALEKANIEIDDFKELNIDCPSTTFNGKDISEYGKTIELKKEDNPLKVKRLELLEILKNIRDNCTEINEKITKSYESSLNNQSVSKVLKKDLN